MDHSSDATAPDRIRVLADKQERVRHYCVTEPLLTRGVNSIFERGSRLQVPEDYERCIDRQLFRCAVTSRSINTILAVPGVIVVSKYDYKLIVTIAAAFDWSECHPAIMSALQSLLFAGKNVIVENSCTPKSAKAA